MSSQPSDEQALQLPASLYNLHKEWLPPCKSKEEISHLDLRLPFLPELGYGPSVVNNAAWQPGQRGHILTL